MALLGARFAALAEIDSSLCFIYCFHCWEKRERDDKATTTCKTVTWLIVFTLISWMSRSMGVITRQKSWQLHPNHALLLN